MCGGHLEGIGEDGREWCQGNRQSGRARKRAKEWNLGLRIYPLEPKRVGFCEARPLDALHITWDGFVTPCVYLTLPVKGDTMAKVHEGESYRIPIISSET